MPSYRTVYDSDGFIPSVDVLDDIECRRLKENFDSLEKDAGTFGVFLTVFVPHYFKMECKINLIYITAKSYKEIRVYD